MILQYAKRISLQIHLCRSLHTLYYIACNRRWQRYLTFSNLGNLAHHTLISHKWEIESSFWKMCAKLLKVDSILHLVQLWHKLRYYPIKETTVLRIVSLCILSNLLHILLRNTPSQVSCIAIWLTNSIAHIEYLTNSKRYVILIATNGLTLFILAHRQSRNNKARRLLRKLSEQLVRLVCFLVARQLQHLSIQLLTQSLLLLISPIGTSHITALREHKLIIPTIFCPLSRYGVDINITAHLGKGCHKCALVNLCTSIQALPINLYLLTLSVIILTRQYRGIRILD